MTPLQSVMKPLPAVLRIRFSGGQHLQHCEWALLAAGQEPRVGTGALPAHAGAVECVLPAADVLILRCRLPVTRRRPGPELLAFAAEESIASDPAANTVCRLALTASGDSVLAVVDNAVLAQSRSAMAAMGIEDYSIHCESLLLPYQSDAWSLGWNGSEGCVRTAIAEGGATDGGDRQTPPLSLLLLLDAARQAGECPTTLVVHVDSAGEQPDVDAWSRALDLDLAVGAPWYWYGTLDASGPVLFQQRRHWQHVTALLPRLRPALWLVVLALGVHVALVMQAWGSLSAEQASLREQMEARFLQVFPNAVVVDPGLQMRRQLTAARQRTGLADEGDFLPLLARAAAAGALPAGSLRTLSYEPGRLTLDVTGLPAADLALLVERLQQAGLGVELQTAAGDGTGSVLTVRPA